MWIVIVPLAAMAAALALVEKRYDGQVRYAAPATRSAAAETAAPAFDLRSRLVEFAWRFERSGEHGQIPNGCSVEETTGSKEITVTVQGSTRVRATSALNAFVAGFEEYLTKTGSAEQARIDTKRTEIGRRLGELQVLVGQAEDQASTVADSVTPVDKLAETLAGLKTRWTAYAELRDRIVEAKARRDELVNTPADKVVDIDPTIRASAYAEHVALREDQRHLEIQLFQVRTSVLATGEAGGENLNRLLDAAQEIGQLTNSAAAENASPVQRPLLEQTSEKAAEYHNQATRFAQAWTRELLALKATTPDPQSADVLESYERLTALVKDFVRTSEDAIGILRRRVRTFEEQSDETASARLVDAAIVGRFHDLQTAFNGFEQVAGDLYAPDNYLLDAALQSARGLWHRTQATRREVDALLKAQALAEATSARHRRIEALTNELERLRGELIEMVDAIMTDAAAAGQIADRVPAYVESATSGETARLRRDLLRAQIAELQTEAQAWAQRATRVAAPANAPTIDKEVSQYPTNVESLARSAGLAGSLSLLGLLGIFRLSDRRRR